MSNKKEAKGSMKKETKGIWIITNQKCHQLLKPLILYYIFSNIDLLK